MAQQKQLNYVKGTVVTLTTGEGKAKLIKRVEDGAGNPVTYSTKNEHQLGSWLVELLDTSIGAQVIRPILEVGTPNKNKPEKINFDEFYVTPPWEVAEKKERIAQQKELKQQRKEQRQAMTENKAKATIKAHHKGLVGADDPVFGQAVAFATHQPWGAKYFKKYLPSMLVDPCIKQ